MIPYNGELAPIPIGLNNTGVICYLNSFLQTLASCTAFIETVRANKEYLHKTKTGIAIYKFVATITRNPSPPYSEISSEVLMALVADLRERRPNDRFGGGQESASETLTFLLEMMEPPADMLVTGNQAGGDFTDTAGSDFTDSSGNDSPVTIKHEISNLFTNRFRCELHCKKCKAVVSTTTENSVNFNLFHIDRSPPKTSEEFSKAIRFHSSITEDYTCEKCPCWNCGGKVVEKRGGPAIWQCESCEAVQKKCTAIRLYKLSLIPEIVFCMFNAYKNKVERYFPEEFRISSTDGGYMVYKLVGQIEHAGGLSGGHYWARGLRSGGNVFMLNDTGVTQSEFKNTANTYIVAYNYAGTFGAA